MVGFLKMHKNHIYLAILILSIFGLMYMFPVLGDDLLHGSVGVGIHFMEGVNGRYLGNLFGINFSSSLILRVLGKSLILLLIIYLLYRLLEEKKEKFFLFLSFLLLMILPKEMLRQVVVNSSGFGNYVVPVLGILLIFLYHLRNFDKKSNKLFGLLLILLGVINSLFVEHMTVYNVILAIFFVVYSLCDKRKNIIPYLGYLVGSITGAALMFLNPVYSSVFAGNDGYRSITLLKDIAFKFVEILNGAFFQNAIIVLLSFAVSIFLFRSLGKDKHEMLWNIVGIFNFIFIIYYIISMVNPSWVLFNSYGLHNKIKVILTVVFYCNFIIISIFGDFTKKEKHFLLLYLFSFLMVLAPLLIVNPIGPRCYFASYIFFILFILKSISILNSRGEIDIKQIKTFVLIANVLVVAFYYDIYVNIYIASERRIANIRADILDGKEETVFSSLPYIDYLHGAETCQEYNERVYKIYYNIDDTVQFIKENCS